MTDHPTGVSPAADGFDTPSAVTRSMLGWGVLAGPIYLVVGLARAWTTDGFDLADHQLSLLMLGDDGWIQHLNLIGTGVLVAVAAVGFARAMRGSRAGRLAPLLVGAFAVGLVGSGIFEPDPMEGFPPGSREGDVTASGLLHLGFGAFQFLALAAACFVVAHWADDRGDSGRRRFSTACGLVVLVGFVGGAALSQTPVGVLLLWVAVLAAFAWLAVTSGYLYGATPHPDPRRRTGT